MRLVKGSNNQCPTKYMLDNPTLLTQLANRCRKWHNDTGITQAQMAKAIGMQDGNYSAFLSGRKGVSAEATCLLLKFTAMGPRQAVATFKKPILSSRIMELQECGKSLRFDNIGYVPKEGSTEDPNGTTSITNISKAQRESVQNLLAVLAALDEVTRKEVVGAIAKAYPNPLGTTAPNGQRFSR
jgi:transcriptional regulator with XRE-family HTH domain